MDYLTDESPFPDHGYGLVHRTLRPFTPFWLVLIAPIHDSQVELTWVAGYIAKLFTCLRTVTHPSTHRGRCKSLTRPLKQIPLIGDVIWRCDVTYFYECSSVYQ